VGANCLRGQDSVVTVWGDIGGSEDGERVVRRGRKSSWEGEQ
jgi:hypothetical protein